jgi:hypothetical protein
MKGDFSRIRFGHGKQYTAVLKQQGRVDLDADANEQCAIESYLRTTEATDVIGQYGGPIHDEGFAISVVGQELYIGRGRYYVGGLLCENIRPLAYDSQPFLIDAATSTQLLEELLSGGGASARVYLEVWQRLVTALDDPCLGEPALGQADTTARLQTVWRVVASQGPLEPLGVACCKAMYDETATPHSGSLSAQTMTSDGDCGCQPMAAAGYVGLENQLYRVEIHQSGDETSAAFKWSRENGSVVTAIQSASGNQVTVAGLGPDANLGFQENQWVELSDDTHLFGEVPNQSGSLYQILHIDAPSSTLTLNTTVVSVDPTRNARMRRWDQSGSGASGNGIVLSESWITLENGIQVSFGKGNYVAGDAWTIPARAATGQIDWPPCGGDGKPFQPAQYAKIYRAPLACIHPQPLKAARTRARLPSFARFSPDHFVVDDCRRPFPPLTDLSAPSQVNALHITGINWSNDDVMTLDMLIANGLSVTFDQAPSSPVTAANFVVILETPIVLNRDNFTTLRSAASNLAAPTGQAAPAGAATPRQGTFFRLQLPTPTVLRNETVLDSALALNGNTVSWSLPIQGVSTSQDIDILAIDFGLLPGAVQGWPGRVRVKLPGRALYANAGDSSQLIYLDGQAFGQTAQTAAGSRSRVDLQFPSGNGDRASDFDSWFYLYPILTVDSVSVTYPALIAIDDGNSVAVYQPPLPPAPPYTPVTQNATIVLNYPAAAAATISLSLVGDSSVASVPTTLAVPVGSSSVTLPITFKGAPAVGTTTTITLSASVNNAINATDARSATFTVTGQAPPIILQ